MTTRFANKVNPFAGLGKMPDKNVKEATKPKASPAPLQALPKPVPQAAREPVIKKTVTLSLDEISVTNDPFPAHRPLFPNKYEAIFLSIQVGQAIRCPTEKIPKLAGSFRKFAKTRKMQIQIKSVFRYQGDPGYGRVWALAEEKVKTAWAT